MPAPTPIPAPTTDLESSPRHPRPAARRIPLPTKPLAVVAASLLAWGLAAAPVAPAAAAGPAETTASNVEEARLSNVVPGASVATSRQFIESSGLQPVLDDLSARLQNASTGQAPEIVAGAARALWTRAVAAARGDSPSASGDRYDDRGLYWARLQARVSVKTWVAADPARGALLAELLRSIERSSRGFDDMAHSVLPGTRRILTTGFDPFQLDQVGQRSNPSGSAALALDGKTIDTASGPAVVQAVVLPVTWSAFDTGMVEDVFGPGLRYGARSIDMLITLSQGRPDGFDIERFAGVWRGGGPDNLNEGEAQGYRQEAPAAPAALGWPQPATSPQFIETTLPWAAVQDARTGPAPVRLNERICIAPTPERVNAQVQCASTNRIDPSWFAVQGGGGDYLSNESMYRANRLRIQMGREDVAGGHLHTQSLDYASIPVGQVTSAPFESARAAVVDQTIEIFGAAAHALRAPAAAQAVAAPAEVSAGDEVTISVTHALPREPIEFRAPGGAPKKVVADDAGSATVTWTVPRDLPAGAQALAFGRQDGSSFSASVTLRGAEVPPTPTATPTAPPATATPSPTAAVSPATTSSPRPAAGQTGAAQASSSKNLLAQTGPSDARELLAVAAALTVIGLALAFVRRRARVARRR